MPLTDEERRELDRRKSQQDGPRGDRGRAPDPSGGAGGGLVFSDEDNVRAAFGSVGSPVGDGASNPRMRGGFGGEGYNNYGAAFGPGAGHAPAIPLTDADDLSRPDELAERDLDDDTGGSGGSRTPPSEAGQGGSAVFSTGARDDASGSGEDSSPETTADFAAATGNPGTTGGTGGGAAGSAAGGRTSGK